MWATMIEHWAFNLQKVMDTAVNRKDLGIPVGDTLFGKTVCSWCIHHCIFDLLSAGNISIHVVVLICAVCRSLSLDLGPLALKLPRG